MLELSQVFKEFTPSTYGIWSLVAMFSIYLIREWRETRKLSAEDRLARRDGYQKQVELLTREYRSALGDLATLRKEYDEHRRLCQVETDQLRKMVIALEGEIAGLKRQDATAQIYHYRHSGEGKI